MRTGKIEYMRAEGPGPAADHGLRSLVGAGRDGLTPFSGIYTEVPGKGTYGLHRGRTHNCTTERCACRSHPSRQAAAPNGFKQKGGPGYSVGGSQPKQQASCVRWGRETLGVPRDIYSGMTSGDGTCTMRQRIRVDPAIQRQGNLSSHLLKGRGQVAT